MQEAQTADPLSDLREMIRSEAERLSAPYMKPDQAASYCGVSKETLSILRKTGGGPRWSKPLPQVVLYHRDDLDAWIREHQAG